MNFKFFINRFFYLFYGEKCFKKFKYNWSEYPNRTQVINDIITKKNYSNYLEIGCFQNDNFDEIYIKKKIGVDPVSGGTHRMTSDDFFKNNIEKFDIIFIDGLHVYEQVKKDIDNSLNFLNDDGIILLHDCLPRKIWYQTPKRMSDTWNGDVWKAIVECRTLEGIDTYTCLADEGIGIIKKRPNKNILIFPTKKFKKLTYKDYFHKHNEYMNIINFEELMQKII